MAAFAIEVFLIPNKLIDGGTVGLAMICAKLTDTRYLPLFLLIINLPFVILAYRSIGKIFVIHMVYAVLMFALSLFLIGNYLPLEFHDESLKWSSLAERILGVGAGFIIRYGAAPTGPKFWASSSTAGQALQ